jgi:hypothetical protein
MKRAHAVLLLAISASLVACDENNGPFTAPNTPVAYTRFVNAVPDTFATDWRFIDQLELSPVGLQVAFRSFTPYQQTAPGSRHIRIFPNPGGTFPAINVVSQVLIDTTVTLTAGSYYTFVHVGFTRAGQSPADRLMVIEDKIADPAANIAVKAVHVGSGMSNVDLFAADEAATAPLPSSPLFSAVGFGSVTNYSTRAPGAFALRMTTSGQTTPVMASVNVPRGDAGNPAANADPIGGSTLAGSVISAFVFPRSVAGSVAPQTAAFQAPSIVYIIDRNPPRPN